MNWGQPRETFDGGTETVFTLCYVAGMFDCVAIVDALRQHLLETKATELDS